MSVNISNGIDTIDGKSLGRQAVLWAFYIAGTILTFFIIRLTILLLSEWTLGAGTTKSLEVWIVIPTILLLGGLITTFEREFWVNPAGNHILPTINQFFPKTIDGQQNTGTRFIVYTTGFALKWPWESKFGVEIEVEREEVHPHQQFNISAKAGASLVIEMVLAWKPFPSKLSSFLQSAGHDPLHPPILKQIAAKAQQLFEEYAASLTDSEKLRKGQTKAISKVLEDIVKNSVVVRQGVKSFAQTFGIDIFDISLTKCDYSTEDQKIRNKAAEGEVVVKLTDKLWKEGQGGYATRADAARAASLIAGVVGITDHNNTLKIDPSLLTPEMVEALRTMGPAALAAWAANHRNQNP